MKSSSGLEVLPALQSRLGELAYSCIGFAGVNTEETIRRRAQELGLHRGFSSWDIDSQCSRVRSDPSPMGVAHTKRFPYCALIAAIRARFGGPGCANTSAHSMKKRSKPPGAENTQ
jgi:hypothetical protein